MPHGDGPDFERGLTSRGVRNCIQMAEGLHDSGVIPDCALVSSARRTQETWDAMRLRFPDTKVKITRNLYLAPSETILDALHKIEVPFQTVMVVGHNPAMHDLALKLVGFGDRYALARLREHLPTAALVVLDFDVEAWSDVTDRSGRLDRFLVPDRTAQD